MNLVLVDLFYGSHSVFPQDLIEFIKNSEKQDIIIFFMIGERYSPSLVNNILLSFFEDYTDKNVIFFCDELNIDKELGQLIVLNKIKCNSQLIKVAQYEDYSKFNTEINLDTGRFLFLMGKPYKTNRLPLLYEFYKNDLLKLCDYSFYHDERYNHKSRQIMNFLSDDEYYEFVKNTAKTLDDITVGIASDFFNYNGLPVDSKLYKNTSFSIISESINDQHNYHFISEKTWRTIANKHMFLSMAHKGYKDYLNNLGLNTFDYCIKHTKENFNTFDWQLSNSYTVENVKWVLENIEQHQDRIKEDVEKNYTVYRNLIENHRKIITPLIEKKLLVTELHGGYKLVQVINVDKQLRRSLKKMLKLGKLKNIRL